MLPSIRIFAKEVLLKLGTELCNLPRRGSTGGSTGGSPGGSGRRGGCNRQQQTVEVRRVVLRLTICMLRLMLLFAEPMKVMSASSRSIVRTRTPGIAAAACTNCVGTPGKASQACASRPRSRLRLRRSNRSILADRGVLGCFESRCTHCLRSSSAFSSCCLPPPHTTRKWVVSASSLSSKTRRATQPRYESLCFL